MSFRYDVLNLDSLTAEPLALKNAQLDDKTRNDLTKCNALKDQILDWLYEEKFNSIIVRGKEFKLVKK